MKNKAKVLGTSLSALVLTGLTSYSVLNKDVVEEKLADNLVDLAFNSKEPKVAKGAWKNPNGDFVYPGFEFIVAPNDNKTVSTYAKELKVSTKTLESLNEISYGNRIANKYGVVFKGSLLYYKAPKSDKKFYYNKSQAKPVQITDKNWKTRESLYLDNTSYKNDFYSSARRLNYSLDENKIDLTASKKLHLEGWVAQTNYTDVTGSNNQSVIIATESGTKNQKQMVTAENTNINPTNQFKYNKNNPTNVALRCPATDVYLDRSIAFSNNGSWSAKSLSGCWHNYTNVGFSADLDLDNLFGGDKHTRVYDLYVAQSTGNNPDRIIHKSLSARKNINRKYTDVGGNYSGTVKFEGKDADIVEGKTTILVRDDELNMYKYLNNSITTNKAPNGTGNNFLPGNYIIEDSGINTKSQTTYYKLKGYGATKGYNGWTSSVLADDSNNKAQLRFVIDDWERFKINFKSGDKDDYGKTINTSEEHKVYQVNDPSKGQYSTKNIYAKAYSKVEASNGIVWRMLPVDKFPTNKDYVQKFDAENPPKDIDYYYTKSYEVGVHYVNANTGQEITSKKVEIPYNQSKTFKFDELGTQNSSDTKLITYNGIQYKYAGDGKHTSSSGTNNIKDYSSEFSKVGLDKGKYPTDLNKYGNGNTQTRTYDKQAVDNGIDDVYFYFYEPQGYTVNHVRLDSQENWVDSTGKITNDLGRATVTRDTGVYYTGDKVDIRAYGVKGNTGRENYNDSFGRYKFGGKGQYEKTPKIYNALSMSSDPKERIATGNYDVPVNLEPLVKQEFGKYGNLYYRKAIADPSGECDITVEKCDVPTPPTKPTDPEVVPNPNEPYPDKPTGLDFDASMKGQYNWYLTKDKGTTSENWKESKLAMTNTGQIGNEEVFAINKLSNTISVDDGKKYTYKSSYKGQEQDIYYSKLISKRDVVSTVGEGVANKKENMSASKVRNNLKDHQKGKELSLTRNYVDLNKEVQLNSKLYEENAIKENLKKENQDDNINLTDSLKVEDHYKKESSKDAVKDHKVDFETTYDYTNRLRDNYKAGESYNGAVFTWNYDFTNPVFNGEKYVNKVNSNIDHKLKEDVKETESINKKDSKITSKVGILRDFSKFKNKNGATTINTMNKGSQDTLELFETFTKKVSSTGKLDTQSKVVAEEQFSYKNDIWNGKLAKDEYKKEKFVGHTDYLNEFTYNKSNGYNKYLVTETDFNFRENSNSDYKDATLSKVDRNQYPKTKLQSDFNFQIGTVATNKAVEKSNNVRTNQNVDLNLVNKYGVLSDSGVLLEGKSYQDIESNIDKKYKEATGYDRSIYPNDKSKSDSLITPNKDTYYIPMDGKSSMKSNEEYTNRHLLSNVGLSDRNIAIDNKYSFENYLVGSTTDNTMFTSYKSSLTKNGKYTKGQVLVTSKEKEAIKTEHVDNGIKSNDTKNFRTLNSKKVNIGLSPYTNLKNLGN